MSVYVLVGELRRWLTAPRASAIPRSWLKLGFGLSLAAYLALKITGIVVELPPAVDLSLVPAGLCALGLALGDREEAARAEGTAAMTKAGLLACAVLVAFTSTYVALNTVPKTFSQDESAMVNGARELATHGSLRVTRPLNERYDTNIIGSLDVTYRSPTGMYHRVFPGTALIYAPFSVFLGSSGYYVYTALFATAAIVTLYLLAWKLLGSWPGALVAALLFAVSPAFGHWAATVFNNVPVLSMEFGALVLILWSTPPRRWQLALAGALMSLAVFVRVTEFIFVLPMLALVWWRCRSVRRTLPYALWSLTCIPVVLITNTIFFDSPFFFPHVGSVYLPLEATPGAGSGQGLVERYFLFVIGVSGSASNFHAAEKVDNLLFHIRYLGSSSFAFPFLAISFAGLAWWVAARRPNAWLLASGLAVAVGAILFLYGHQHGNYYGFGQSIARSSFVRYSLPIYALLSIAGGAFFLEAAKVLRPGASAARYALFAAVALVGVIGIFRSYDAHVYGFNRLNYSREHDRTAWRAVDNLLQQHDKPVLLFVGFNSMKLVDGAAYPDTVNYSVLPPQTWDDLLFPVVDQALQERVIYLLVSGIQPESHYVRAAFDERYYTVLVLRSTNWVLYEVQPGIYEAAP